MGVEVVRVRRGVSDGLVARHSDLGLRPHVGRRPHRLDVHRPREPLLLQAPRTMWHAAEIRTVSHSPVLVLSSCVLPFVRPFVCLSVCLSDYHEPVLYRNDWTNRAGFGHGGFLPPVPHCGIRKLGYLQKFGYFSLELCPKLRTSKIRHDKSIALSTKLVIGVRGKIEFGGGTAMLSRQDWVEVRGAAVGGAGRPRALKAPSSVYL